MMDYQNNLDFYLTMSRKELQKLCNQHDLPANRSHAQLADSLVSLFKKRNASSAALLENSINSMDRSCRKSFVSEPKASSSKVDTHGLSSGFNEIRGDDRLLYHTGNQIGVIGHMVNPTSGKPQTLTNALCPSWPANSNGTESIAYSAQNHLAFDTAPCVREGMLLTQDSFDASFMMLKGNALPPNVSITSITNEDDGDIYPVTNDGSTPKTACIDFVDVEVKALCNTLNDVPNKNNLPVSKDMQDSVDTNHSGHLRNHTGACEGSFICSTNELPDNGCSHGGLSNSCQLTGQRLLYGPMADAQSEMRAANDITDPSSMLDNQIYCAFLMQSTPVKGKETLEVSRHSPIRQDMQEIEMFSVSSYSTLESHSLIEDIDSNWPKAGGLAGGSGCSKSRSSIARNGRQLACGGGTLGDSADGSGLARLRKDCVCGQWGGERASTAPAASGEAASVGGGRAGVDGVGSELTGVGGGFVV
ncbi:hypothetical protein MUK42_18759 [Musa troglodytarum]|uniref:Uncharacterized protein n=1 Tax=Musa troglodytarum TaxID=320322 RepID=A0A9E7ENC1_9LILI|nr:hypothetical protein MUK42_18759 [Musa troglodytarum]